MTHFLKIFSFLFIVILVSGAYAQEGEILNLFGISDSTGKYHLIYEDQIEVYSSSYGKRINFIDTQNNIDSAIVKEEGWWETGQAGIKSILDYEFFSNDPFSLISVGISGMVGNYVENMELQTKIDLRTYNSSQIIINKKKPNIIHLTTEYLEGYSTSIDSGRTWPYGLDTLTMDSMLVTVPFNLLSLYPNSDSTMFGIDTLGNLLKSDDAGLTTEVVEESGNWNPLRENIYYDKDLKHLYAISKKDGNYYLYISDNAGNNSSWNLLFTSNSKISISTDTEVSGKFCFAANNIIYQSLDYGSTYNLLYEINNNIVGIFTVPNSDTLYAGTSLAIFEITPHSKTAIKEVTLQDSTDFFPLQIGNRWQYSENNVVVLESMAIGDTMMLNSKTYTNISGSFAGYYRKEGSKVYLYNTSTDEEDLKYDFSLKEGDTLSVEADDQDTLIIWVSSTGYTEIFGETRKYLAYRYEWLNFSEDVEKVFVDGIGYSQHSGGMLFYGLTGAVIDGKRYGTIVRVDKSKETMPTKFSLQQNYPNPFNPETVISYHLPVMSEVMLKVYDVLGREVVTLVNREQSPGSYEVQFDASNLVSGIYLYQLRADSFIESKKMIFLK